MVDTNSDPREVDYVIPANDDASKSIDKILTLVTAAIVDGLANRTSDKEADAAEVVVAETEEATAVEAEELLQLKNKSNIKIPNFKFQIPQKISNHKLVIY